MAVSYRRMIDEPCATCGVPVEDEEWLILDRAERPGLWAAWRAFPGPVITCAAGHLRDRDMPLILYDPADVYAIVAMPGFDDISGEPVRSLLARLLAALPPGEAERCLERITVVPRFSLHLELLDPWFNLGDFAPGAEQTTRLAADYAALRRSPGAVERFLADAGTTPALRAALHFDQAVRLRGMVRDAGPAATADLVEEVIEHLRLALEFYRRDAFALRWALVHAELASAYHERRLGDRRVNVGEAARCAESALEVLDPDRYPEDYAHTQISLANAVLDGAGGEAVDVDRQIAAYRAALRVYNRHSYPRDWVQTNTNLATAYLQRGGQDDVRAAIGALRAALTVASPARTPYEWALARMHLGMALWRTPEGRSGVLRDETLTALRDAHEFLDSERGAAAGFNLGMALAGSDDPVLADESVGLLTEARRHLIESGDSEQAEACRYWLVRAFHTGLRHGSPSPYELTRRALEVFAGERDAPPVGVLFHELARHLHDADSVAADSRMELAERAVRRALLILRRREHTEERAKALANLAMICVRRAPAGDGRPDIQLARDCYRAALRFAERLPDSARRNELIGNISIHLTGADFHEKSLGPDTR